MVHHCTVLDRLLIFVVPFHFSASNWLHFHQFVVEVLDFTLHLNTLGVWGELDEIKNDVKFIEFSLMARLPNSHRTLWHRSLICVELQNGSLTQWKLCRQTNNEPNEGKWVAKEKNADSINSKPLIAVRRMRSAPNACSLMFYKLQWSFDSLHKSEWLPGEWVSV